MSTAPVLVLGAAGMLGRVVTAVLREQDVLVEASTRRDFDVLTDSWDRYAWDKYAAVINALGAIPQRCDDPREFAIVNRDFPQTIAPRCARWIQMSTDCVFSGRCGAYTVDDFPDESGPYGRSKADGEIGVVVRGSFVGEGTAQHLLEVVRASTVMRGYVDHWWNGVTALQMARVLAQLASDVSGPSSTVLHVAGPTRLSKHEVCRAIAEAYEHRLLLRACEAGFVDRTLVPTWPVEDGSLVERLVEQRAWYREQEARLCLTS